MISGTRFYANEDLFVSQEDAARAAAFIEADIKQKEKPPSVVDLLPIPGSKTSPRKSQSYIIFLQIGAKKTILQDSIWTVSTRCFAIYKLGLKSLRQTESL